MLDVRWELATGADHRAYLQAHIPGAVFADLDLQFADPPGERGRHPLPRAERFAAEMRSLGVSAGRDVVVYDAATSMAAARAWWVLCYFGHPDVKVLDGGLAAWLADGRPVTADVPTVAPGDFVSRPGGMPRLDADQLARVVADGVLIDARAPERFRGDSEPLDPVAGHIPGAVNRPASHSMGPEGRFLKSGKLRAAFELLGVDQAVPVGVYCGSGVTAAHEVLALELAGFRASLYPGSWSEWITDPARAVARGVE